MSKTDTQLHEEIAQRFEQAWFDAQHIAITVSSRKVTLTGHVTSWESKRSAQDLAENVSGVLAVDNQIKILPRFKS